MPSPVIQVQGVSKKFHLGSSSAGNFHTLRDSLAAIFKKKPSPEETPEDFWALNDVSFDVHAGEVLGIIGANGAGKSTLLKILSRITEPTSGEIVLRGRLASLLEVGTGFHPELSGRENIFLNGVILGMKRDEVVRNFDEIVAFSGVEKFLDTPVKRYSSGMYVRLAFAVAAHLTPEILIIDEVLAVGDLAFQQKCLSKMQDIAQNRGRSILFVSHNLAAIRRLCTRVLVLDKGKTQFIGTPEAACRTYLEKILPAKSIKQWDSSSAPGNDIVRLTGVGCLTSDGHLTTTIDVTDAVVVRMEFLVLKGGEVLVPNFHFLDQEGTCLFIAQDLDPAWRGKPRPPGSYTCDFLVPANFLSEGTLVIGAAITTMLPFHVHVFESSAIRIDILDKGSVDSARGDFSGDLPGVIRPLLKTSTRFSPSETVTSTTLSRI